MGTKTFKDIKPGRSFYVERFGKLLKLHGDVRDANGDKKNAICVEPITDEEAGTLYDIGDNDIVERGIDFYPGGCLERDSEDQFGVN